MTYYELLGVAPDASREEIKAAHRKLASEHHPDKGGDTAFFQEIQHAFDILYDEVKRAAYDRGELNVVDPAVHLEQTACSSLIAIFHKIISTCDEDVAPYVDIQSSLLAEIEQGMASCEQQFKHNQATLRKLRVIKRRILAGEFIFSDHIKMIRRDIIMKQRAWNKQREFLTKVAERMREMVMTLDYDFDAQPRMNNALPMFQLIFKTGDTFQCP